MVKRIDSDALHIVNRSLGMTGAGSPVTELADGVVDQVLEVGQVARRGRALGPGGGLFYPTIRNEHTDAESIRTNVDPYNVGTTGLVAPYPNPVPPQFDIYLIGASIRSAAGTASGMTLSTLSIEVPTPAEGWGLTDSGVAVLVAEPIRLVMWNAMTTDGTSFGIRAVNRGPHERSGLRLPRVPGMFLSFASVSTVTVSIDCQMILGLFPVALGQDGLF